MVINEERFLAFVQEKSGAVLPEVLRNQLNEPTTDGQPDENARANCVMASFAAALSEETGDPWYGDQLKDAIYGQGYTGATDPERVAPKVAALTKGKATSWVIKGSPAQLLAAIKAQIDLGHPVIIEIPSRASDHTNPSQKVTIPSGNQLTPGVSTHANCVFGYRNGNLVVMDPWPGWIHEAPESWWESQFVYGRIEPVAKEEVVAIIVDKDAAGQVVGAHDEHDPSLKVGAGVAEAIIKNNLLAGSIAVPETKLSEGETVAVLRGGAKCAFTYSDKVGVTVVSQGDAVQALNDLFNQAKSAAQSQAEAEAANQKAQDALAAAQAQVADLEKQLAAAVANVGDPAKLSAAKDALSKAQALLAPSVEASQEVAAALAVLG